MGPFGALFCLACSAKAENLRSTKRASVLGGAAQRSRVGDPKTAPGRSEPILSRPSYRLRIASTRKGVWHLFPIVDDANGNITSRGSLSIDILLQCNHGLYW